MQPIETRRPVALIASILLASTVFASIAGQGSAGAGATAEHDSVGRSALASEVEAAIAQTDLAGRMEAALGNDFAGIWFEPSTARVHVGFTSADARGTEEAVAARAGLADAVIETPVNSTWTQLEAGQARWGHRLDDLFARAEAATALDADRNSVVVELGSSVSATRRAQLARKAAADSVQASIVVAPRPRLQVVSQLRCVKFAESEAFCDPTIVSGTTIKSPWRVLGGAEEEEIEDVELEYEDEEEAQTKRRYACTAGPAAIFTDRSDAEKRTKTYLLTAGHCINEKKGGGGVNVKWTAYDKKGAKAGESELGTATAYLDDKTDIGVIEVKRGYWAKDKDPIPVTAEIARWSKTEETDPFPVITQVTPVENAEACVSGQTSGTKCGKVLTLDRNFKSTGGAVRENFVEVEVPTIKGDSGAPWFADTQYTEKTRTGYVLGVHSGLFGKNAVFQPLGPALSELKARESLDLELLRRANERRHPQFTASEYPVTISAEDTASADLFTAFGVSVECTENEFHGEVSEPKEGQVVSAVELTPVYKSCLAAGILPVKMTSNGCKLKFSLTKKVSEDHYNSNVDIVCPAEQPGMQFLVYSNHTNFTGGSVMCTVTMPPQSGLERVTLMNGVEQIVADAGTVEGVKIKSQGTFLCPGGGGGAETSAGVYHLEDGLTISGSNEEAEVAIDLAGT